MISYVVVNASESTINAISAKFVKFCLEHNLTASASHSHSFDDLLDGHGYRYVGESVKFEIQNFDIIGIYSYDSHSMSYSDHSVKLSNEDLDKIHTKACYFCNAKRTKKRAVIAKINGKLEVVGIGCFKNKVRADGWFDESLCVYKDKESDQINGYSGFIDEYATDLYRMIGYINSNVVNHPIISKSCAEISNKYRELRPAAMFKNAEYKSEVFASEDEVSSVLNDIDSLDESKEFSYTIKRILEDIKETEGYKIKKGAIPVLMGYLINRVECNILKNAVDAAETSAIKNVEATLVYSKLFYSMSAYGDSIKAKLIFRTIENTLVEWYTTSNAANEIGKKYYISAKSVMIRQDKDRLVLSVKRPSIKAA